NHGILVYHSIEKEKCLCPAQYYGVHCEYQSQRLSITMRTRKQSALENQLTFKLHIYLIDYNDQKILSYEQIPYLCFVEQSFTLLYDRQSKPLNKTYVVRIDIFSLKISTKQKPIEYRTSYYYSINYLFLPIQHLTIDIMIPENNSQPQLSCSLQCGKYGDCYAYFNQATEFYCRCHPGWTGKTCEEQYKCQCSQGSLCV
ncbi:unnamed protein product, partial [Didymodactylos carnosus]